MANQQIKRVKIIDSHTGGEPTRVVVSGGPDLGNGSMAERLERFKNDFDQFRSAVVNEPRGNDSVVGLPASSAGKSSGNFLAIAGL